MKIIRYIVWLLPLLLNSCDFFYSTVTYKGPEADPHLCVEARLATSPNIGVKKPQVYVMHSAFFLDNYVGDFPLVDNAVVTVQVNHDRHVSGTYVQPTYDTYTGMLSSGGYYTFDLALAPRDSVLLNVAHPLYGKAEARQVCPAEQSMTVTVDSISRLGEVYAKMHLSGYQGSPTDVVTFTAKVDMCQVSMKYENTTKDTVLVFEADSVAMVMYSPDECFAQYENKQLSSGYYAGYSLTLPVSSEDRVVPIILDSHLFTGVGEKELIIDYTCISIRTEVRTIEDYDYYTSLAGVLGNNDIVPSPSSQIKDEQSDMKEYMENAIQLIRIAFDELGNVEESQIYGNLSGDENKKPIGCFSLVNVSNYMLKASTELN